MIKTFSQSKLRQGLIVITILFTMSCALHSPHPTVRLPTSSESSGESSSYTSSDNRQTSNGNEDWIANLPGDEGEFLAEAKARIANTKLYHTHLTKAEIAEEQERLARRLAQYMAFLVTGFIAPPDNPKTKHINENTLARPKLIDKHFDRLMNSALQFIACPNLEDFVCLEKLPLLQPNPAMRVEEVPPATEDGEIKSHGDIEWLSGTLDSSLEAYFTTQFLIPEDDVVQKNTVAAQLAKKITSEATTSLDMALYGLDDIDGSMKTVFEAILAKIDNRQIPVRAVFDQEGINKGSPRPLIMSYIAPTDPNELSRWILTPTKGLKTHMAFQYNGGTQELIKKLAEGAKSENDATGRIEWSDSDIMHNKFFVFGNSSQRSVWTGTANVSRSCMGTERNSNMAIFIKNNKIADAFLAEFSEMYEYSGKKTTSAILKKATGPKSQPQFPYGRFHGNKKPNTHRYFRFNENTPQDPSDDTDFKVYFSPTDDAEHRAILPMLHSAKPGDILRISMFGGAGIEYVRAFQLAAARGVKVEIILDSSSGRTPGSWAASSGDATLLQPNPFLKLAASERNQENQISFRKNKRGSGGVWYQNHQKIGLLLRNTGSGHRAEQLVVGSQNWSAGANDQNDENLIVIRNLKGLKVGEEFNEHFTTTLWPAAVDIVSSAQ